MALLMVGVALLSLLAISLLWFSYRLFLQNGRLLLRVEALEARVAALATPGAGTAAVQAAPSPPPGLAVGQPAPAFELPDLDGKPVSLAQFRGQRVMLVFFNPGCGYCTRMAPDLAAIPRDGANGRPIPLVISTGGVEENRKLAIQAGLPGPVLLQKNGELASQYQTYGTPMGYLIDEAGLIASPLTVGAEALLALAQPRGGPNAAAPVAATAASPSLARANGATNGKAHRYQGNRSLQDSHINRQGLSAGTPAPDFRLPRVEGGHLALHDFRGRRVLLVFSDPECGPCNDLAPHLERLAQGRPDLQVVMISRGDRQVNRAKVAEHHLTFPVALQRSWEVSRDYGMFATPIGYLIDEQGVLVSDVAVGVEAILGLVAVKVLG